MVKVSEHMKEMLKASLYITINDYRGRLTNREVLQILKEICLDIEILANKQKDEPLEKSLCEHAETMADLLIKHNKLKGEK